MTPNSPDFLKSITLGRSRGSGAFGTFPTYHLIAGQPVSFLLDAGLGAFAADGQRLHHQAVLHGQAQLPGRLLRVHAEHSAQVPVKEEGVKLQVHSIGTLVPNVGGD